MKHAVISHDDPHYLPKELQHMVVAEAERGSDIHSRYQADNSTVAQDVSHTLPSTALNSYTIRPGVHNVSHNIGHKAAHNTANNVSHDTARNATHGAYSATESIDHRAVLVMVHGASGGIGTSTFAAMLAWSLKLRQYECALVDLNLQAGGLDILLGQEAAPGLRWSQIRAPLGSIDAQSLCQELPRWQGMSLLASDPWKATPTQWWEVNAAVRALVECKDIVIADIGTITPPLQNYEPQEAQSSGKHAAVQRGNIGEAQTLPDVLQMMAGLQVAAHTTIHIVVVEMSVLGLARAQGMIQAWQALDTQWRNCIVVGFVPQVPKNIAVDRGSAQQYLNLPIVAQLSPIHSVRTSIVSGLGLAHIPRKYKKSLRQVIQACQEFAPSVMT